tara:strand:- start:177 stop:854 length:678 start_codon:yes stop_codon:yes gene_type:complete
MAISFLAVQELNQRYNDDPRSFSDEEAEMIAGLSQQFGLDFQRTSRPLAKGAFDFADIATFGMLPNKWRPESRGDLAYGETGLDKFAGGAGSLGGLLGAAGVAKGLFRGGKAAYGAFRGSGSAGGATTAAGGGGAAAEGEIVRKSSEGITRTGRGLLPPYEGAEAVASQRLLPGPPLRVGGPSMLELTASRQKLLGPYRPADYPADYLNTSFNQAFSRYGQPQPF